MSNDPTEKLFFYITMLEETNEQLVKTLEMCIELLSQFKLTAPSPESWQEMLDLFNKALRTGQRMTEKKPSTEAIKMAEKLDDKDIVSFKELLMANSMQVDTLSQLLIEKGLITQEEFFIKLKQVQAEYDAKKANSH